MNCPMKKIFLFIICLCVNFILHAGKAGPQYSDIRLLGIGNAGVATHQDRHIMYLNPAGLRQIPRPFSIGLPFILGTGDMFVQAYDFISRNKDVFENGSKNITPARSEQFYNDLREFDRKDIILLNMQGEIGFALLRRFGLGCYVNQETHFIPDMGILNPIFYAQVFTDVVFQGTIAFNASKSVSLGFSPKIMARFEGEKVVSPAASMFAPAGVAPKKANAAGISIKAAGIVGALDFGTQVRLDSLNTIGFTLKDLGKGVDSLNIVPTVHLGYAWKADSTVKKWWKRNTLFALDLRGIGAPMPLLSRVNFGIERSAHLWFIFDGALRAGASSGYPTFGIGLSFIKVFNLDYATYANENGFYPGQEMERKHMVQLHIGF